jgi:hypothetical protein
MNHLLMVRLTPTAQELLRVVIVRITEIGQALGDEITGQYLVAVDFDAMPPGGIAVGQKGGNRELRKRGNMNEGSRQRGAGLASGC